jgi:hypothetical protein
MDDIRRTGGIAHTASSCHAASANSLDLIPAGGRLLLAIGERLAADRGLVSVFDDTDSMAFADYHKVYSRQEFREKVREITD